MRSAFYQQLPGETKKELVIHGFARHAARAPHDGPYQAVYSKAFMVEGAMRAVGAFKPRGDKLVGPSKRTREQRLAALGGG